MPYTNNPESDTDLVRLKVGDTNVDLEYLTDDWYNYFISKNSGNLNRASLDAARSILASFTGSVREKTDQVEIYGNEYFSNYLEFLNNFVNNPNLSPLSPPMPYCGGLSLSDMEAKRSNQDLNTLRVRLGMISESTNFCNEDRKFDNDCELF